MPRLGEGKEKEAHEAYPHREPQEIQLRFRITITLEKYVSQEAWRWDLLSRCPLHSEGGCGFCRHGSYVRLYPVVLRIARYYCRKGKTTFSLLPDCLASGVSGTLDEIELAASTLESSTSLMEAAQALRPDDPSADLFRARYRPRVSSAKGETAAQHPQQSRHLAPPDQEAVTPRAALQWLRRRQRWVTGLLITTIGLMPERFAGCDPTIDSFRAVLGTQCVLVTLRELCQQHLGTLAARLDFGGSGGRGVFGPEGSNNQQALPTV